MKAQLVAALVLRSVFDCPAAEPGKSPAIRRLDGTTITTADAESFARKTMYAAHVTGAQIAVLDRGRLAWGAGFGLGRRVNHEGRLFHLRDASGRTRGIFAGYPVWKSAPTTARYLRCLSRLGSANVHDLAHKQR
jgi:hypothetical protein